MDHLKYPAHSVSASLFSNESSSSRYNPGDISTAASCTLRFLSSHPLPPSVSRPSSISLRRLICHTVFLVTPLLPLLTPSGPGLFGDGVAVRGNRAVLPFPWPAHRHPDATVQVRHCAPAGSTCACFVLLFELFRTLLMALSLLER